MECQRADDRQLLGVLAAEYRTVLPGEKLIVDELERSVRVLEERLHQRLTHEANP